MNNEEMYSIPRYIFIISAIALCVVVYMTTWSLLAVGVTITLISMAVYVSQLMEKPIFPLSWDLAIVPSASSNIFKKWKLPENPGGMKEVFHITGNKYTYDEAPAVCAAYDSELATYEQVLESFTKGAEWCGYGWTLGGMALFPTQDSTWKKIQLERETKRRMRCGRPGINGGYFDTHMKLGVNCYGRKPGCNNRKYPIPLGDDVDPELVNKYREESSKIKVSPFNRFGWSMWGMLG